MSAVATEARALPVAVIGAGPVGLAAAAHLIEEGLRVVVLEAGDQVGASVREWGHVRLFTPWRYSIDAAAARLLAAERWQAPPVDELPTGHELIDAYLRPLAASRPLRDSVLPASRVVAVARQVDRIDDDRRGRPFVVRYLRDGVEHELTASAVIDATGTWRSPHPLGANGLPARGEGEVRDLLSYGIPDVLGTDRDAFAGRTIAVVGSGHSAAHAVLALLDLRRQDGATRVHWVVRGRGIRAFGGGDLDELPARALLGERARGAIDVPGVVLHERFPVDRIGRVDGRAVLESSGRRVAGLDRVIVATGQRPDHALAAELRLDLDPALESARALAPLIDPNVHTCGTVRPHSYRELAHPDAGYFIAGAKSYGRAPTFLLATGYEQVRSIVAHLAGDDARASRVALVLPAAGACAGGEGSCCSTSPSRRADDEEPATAIAGSCCG